MKYFKIILPAIFLLLTDFTAKSQIITVNSEKYISLSLLKKNTGKPGRNIYGLINQHISRDADSLKFDEYTVRCGGGYMLPGLKRIPGIYFAVSYWYSDSSIFRLFMKWRDAKAATVMDVLEIKKSMLNKDYTIVEQLCYSFKPDPEIIALVKDDYSNKEYFSTIIKAWRSNRNTGKFEELKEGTVRKCDKESEGL